MDSCYRLAPELLKLTANSLLLAKPPTPPAQPSHLESLVILQRTPARPLIHAGDYYYRAQRNRSVITAAVYFYYPETPVSVAHKTSH